MATATDKRVPVLPDLPTIAEQGVAGIDIVGWQGFFGPGGMHPDVVKKISAALTKIVKATISNLIRSQGNEPTGTGSDEFSKIVRNDYERWGAVIKRTGIKAGAVSMHDLVIRDAKIVDGSGAAVVYGDVAVDNGRIVQVSGSKAGAGKARDQRQRCAADAWLGGCAYPL